MSFEERKTGSIKMLEELKTDAESLLSKIESLIRELPSAINEQEATDLLDKYDLDSFKHIEIF